MKRWLQEIGNYNLTITHRTGRQHGNADALSRKPCKACSKQQDKNTELEAKDKEESVISMDNPFHKVLAMVFSPET
jgi:hypothetical protein